MWAGGPPNHVKDGIQPLQGLVETDWLPFPFTMNWIFTRPGRVKFARGEPFCFITPIQDKPLESIDLIQKTLTGDADLHGQYEAWRERRDDFNARLFKRDPGAVKEAWQRYYFKGEMPGDAPGPKTHVNKRRMKSLKLGI
jgi:hypothetical protein